MTSLIDAIQLNQRDLLEELLAQGANIQATDDQGNTPLHIAATAYWTTGIYVLVQAGALLNVQNRNGDSPIHLAIQANQEDSIYALAKAGAYLRLRNGEGMTPVELLQKRNDPDFLNLILKQESLKEKQELDKTMEGMELPPRSKIHL